MVHRQPAGPPNSAFPAAGPRRPVGEVSYAGRSEREDWPTPHGRGAAAGQRRPAQLRGPAALCRFCRFSPGAVDEIRGLPLEWRIPMGMPPDDPLVVGQVHADTSSQLSEETWSN